MMESLNFFYVYIVSCVLVFIYALIKDRKQYNLHLDGIAKFVGFITLVSMYRLCVYDSSSLDQIQTIGLRMSNFLIVFLEDAFFVMIPYYITKKIKNKALYVIIWALFSILFASGHLYQGYFVAAITGLYPYFISRKYALKTSFITVMACHFIYDCATLLTIKIAKILKVMQFYI